MSLQANPLVRDWLRVEKGRLVIRTGKVDIGQRISTALVRIAAQETTLPPDSIDVGEVATGRAPDEGITSGSNSIEHSGAALRAAAATARRAALSLAAETLGAEPLALRLADGAVGRLGANDALRLLDLLAALPPDLAVDAAAPSLDGPPPPTGPPRGMAAMTRGSFAFVHDIHLPGMVHARVVRPPHAQARLADLDADVVARLTGDGVGVVRDGSFLAVTAPGEWRALRAAAQLARGCAWDGRGGLSEADVFDHLTSASATRMPLDDGRPVDRLIPPPLADPTLTAEFQRPYTAHGSLAPSAALAIWDGARLRVTCHSQGVYPLRQTMAAALGLDEAAIEIVFAPGSGCYGHNGADDAAFEAALVAMATPNTPVLLKWTREDEHAWAPVGPAAVVRLAARLEGRRIAAWSGEAYSDTHRGRPRPGPDGAGPARLLASRFRAKPHAPYIGTPNLNRHGGMHRNLDPVYAVGERRMVKNLVSGGPLRTSALRTLGATVNVFAIESFMDELAHTAGVTPLAFRLAHLTDPRAHAALGRLDALMADAPPIKGAARGLAYAQYKNAQTRVAVGAEVSVAEDAQAQVRRLWLAADAGRVIDPDGLTAQLEGGALQATGWALRERVTWDRDGVTSRDWDGTQPLRFSDAPEVCVQVIDRTDAPSVGAGEAACSPTVAAIANAIAAATGLRPRRMPFDAASLRELALR